MSWTIIMSSDDLMKKDVKNAIEELRQRVKDITLPNMYDHTHMFYRFLKARDFDIDKAEDMFRKHITWRKAYQVDTILERFHPQEVYQKYVELSIIGMDKNGDLILYSPAGNYDIKNVLKCITINNNMKNWIYTLEKFYRLLEKHNEQTGRNSQQAIIICDLDKLSIGTATSYTSAEILMGIFQLLQDNYPERLKAIYIINAPAFYVFAYNIVKRVLSNETVKKVQFFGRSGWKELLLKVIDKDVLPAFLGGTRTDPDGNPLCTSFLVQGGIFPSKYFLTDEERWFPDRSLVKILTIEPRQKESVLVEVKEQMSIIQWVFEVKSKDIGFGLFYENDDKVVEVLPIRKISTVDGTEADSYRAALAGTYIIIFDNSHSSWSKKEVHYTITITKAKP